MLLHKRHEVTEGVLEYSFEDPDRGVLKVKIGILLDGSSKLHTKALRPEGSRRNTSEELGEELEITDSSIYRLGPKSQLTVLFTICLLPRFVMKTNPNGPYKDHFSGAATGTPA